MEHSEYVPEISSEQREMVALAFITIGSIADAIAAFILGDKAPEDAVKAPNGYEAMLAMNEIVKLISGPIGGMVVSTALFDGSIPEDVRAQFFGGDLAVNENGEIVYAFNGPAPEPGDGFGAPGYL